MQCPVHWHPPLEQTGLRSSSHVCKKNKQTKTTKKTPVVSDDVMTIP